MINHVRDLYGYLSLL
jgi:hypothetical protein